MQLPSLAFPECSDFKELFTSIKRHELPVGQSAPDASGTTRSVSTYCSGCRHPVGSLIVQPSAAVIKVIEDTMLSIYGDKIYFEITARDDGSTLICAKYNQILGSRWLAVVPTNTVVACVGLLPEEPEEVTKAKPAAAGVAKQAHKKIPDDVRGVLFRMEWEHGACRITDGQLDRKMYQQVNDVLVAAGGKWNKKDRVHKFADGDAEALIRESISTGYYLDEKQAFQFFETPAGIAAKVAETARNLSRSPLKSARVLEPSAGTGNLLAAMWDLGYHGNLCAYEINDKYIEKLKKRLPGAVKTIAQVDFLNVPPPLNDDAYFDIVVMNPPFHKLADAQHVAHALDFLKPTGVLVAIMCPAWTYREHPHVTTLREKLRDYYNAWELLPEGAFSTSGTGVRTGILTARHA